MEQANESTNDITKKKGDNSSPSKKMSIDELLSMQSLNIFKGTIELVENNLDLVKVTPWIPVGGCLCQLAINISTSAIDSVELTGETHLCCGKTLQVVEITFMLFKMF